jgi:hypothetical protein
VHNAIETNTSTQTDSTKFKRILHKPVIMASSTKLEPCATTPSVGMRSPGNTLSRSPRCTRSRDITRVSSDTVPDVLPGAWAGAPDAVVASGECVEGIVLLLAGRVLEDVPLLSAIRVSTCPGGKSGCTTRIAYVHDKNRKYIRNAKNNKTERSQTPNHATLEAGVKDAPSINFTIPAHINSSTYTHSPLVAAASGGSKSRRNCGASHTPR